MFDARVTPCGPLGWDSASFPLGMVGRGGRGIAAWGENTPGRGGGGIWGSGLSHLYFQGGEMVGHTVARGRGLSHMYFQKGKGG